jgi:hypothetical protein
MLSQENFVKLGLVLLIINSSFKCSWYRIVVSIKFGFVMKQVVFHFLKKK